MSTMTTLVSVKYHSCLGLQISVHSRGHSSAGLVIHPVPIGRYSKGRVSLESFSWNKNYLTGLPEVDEQHRHLVRVINEFGGLLAQNELEFRNIERVFEELASYAKYHFRSEESLMNSAGIDKRHSEKHREEHYNFLEDVASMRAAVTPETPNAAITLFEFLTHWLAYHILGSDKNMARQIAAIQKGHNPDIAYKEYEKDQVSETEPLLAALNGLFQQVSMRNRELSELNDTLEERVLERTRELYDANKKLEEMALTDVLTKLPNRRYAMQRLKQLWRESGHSKTPLSCMMIDADGFKEINDSYGHSAGDKVLERLALELSNTLRSDDIVCRLGGDEFLVICPNTPEYGAKIIAEDIRNVIDALRIDVGKGEWQGSVSVGVAARSAEMKKPGDLLKLADQGVYLAKNAGRNCVKIVKADN